jgi:mRNA interferase MazF
MKLKQGDIVLVPFPFTDLKDRKVRPAVVVSNQLNKHSNFILAKITSVIRADQYSFHLDASWFNRTLDKPSEVRTNELMTLHESLIIKQIGNIDKESVKMIISAIIQNLQAV